MFSSRIILQLFGFMLLAHSGQYLGDMAKLQARVACLKIVYFNPSPRGEIFRKD